MSREWRFYVSDMIDFPEKVLAYTHELDQSRFEQSGLNYDAPLRNPELDRRSRHAHPRPCSAIRQPHRLRRIVATRNRLIHGYLGIDNDTLWSIIRTDIPPLLQNLRALKTAADSGQIADPVA